LIRIIFATMVILFASFISAQTPAGKTFRRVQVVISESNDNGKNIEAGSDGLWLEYVELPTNFVRATGEKRTVLVDLIYELKIAGEYIKVGSIDLEGIRNSAGVLIFPFSPDNVASKPVGLSSRTLKFPFSPNLVLSTDGKLWETDSVALIRLNVKNRDISIIRPEM